jgi:hypothetical protein
LIKNINNEIKKNKEKLEKLPHEYSKEDFYDIFENLLKKFLNNIIEIKKDPNQNGKKLLIYEIKEQYKEYIKQSKEKVNEFLTLQFCNYVTNYIKMKNSEQISILEDNIPFQTLITPKIKEILKIFDDIIKKYLLFNKK